MKRRVLVLAGAVVVVGVIAGMNRRSGPGGQPTPEAAVEAYLSGLNLSDRDKLGQVADPDHDPGAEIESRIEKYGQGRLAVTQTDIGDPDSAPVRHATLTGRLNGQPWSETLELRKHDDRWYVVLGPPKSNET